MIDWFHFVMQTTELTQVNQFEVFGLISTAGPVVKLTLLILLRISFYLIREGVPYGTPAQEHEVVVKVNL